MIMGRMLETLDIDKNEVCNTHTKFLQGLRIGDEARGQGNKWTQPLYSAFITYNSCNRIAMDK